MTDFLSSTVAVLVLLAGLAVLVLWVREDSFSGPQRTRYPDVDVQRQTTGSSETTPEIVHPTYRSPAIARFLARELSGS